MADQKENLHYDYSKYGGHCVIEFHQLTIDLSKYFQVTLHKKLILGFYMYQSKFSRLIYEDKKKYLQKLEEKSKIVKQLNILPVDFLFY